MTGEEFTDALYRTPVADRTQAIDAMRSLRTLRSAVDLAGHDAQDMTALRCRAILRAEWCPVREARATRTR